MSKLKNLVYRVQDSELRESLLKELLRLSVDNPRLEGEIVEKYLRNLEWVEASDHEITLVAGNIRAFASWVRDGDQES